MKCFILTLLLAIPLLLSASQKHLKFSHVPLPKNISSKSVRAFTEDDKGYLWFGTKTGLYRYDGYEFQRKSEKNIYNLINDGNGVIWVVTFDGFYKYNIHSEEFTHVELPFSKYIGHNVIKSYKGEIIFASSKGFCIIDPKTDEIKHYQKIEGLEKGLSHNIVRVIYEDKDHNLWIGTHDKLNFFDRKNDKFVNYRIQDKEEIHKKNNLILDIIPLHKENDDFLLIGTETGLAIFDRKKGTFEKFHHNKSPNSLSNEVVKSLCRVNTDEVWIGTGNGLNTFNIKTKSFERFYASYNNHHSISDDIVYKVYKDKNNTIWLGTNRGIDRITLSDDTFLVNTIPGAKSLLEMGTSINRFAFDKNGDIWFATNKKGLVKYDKEKDTYFYYTSPQILHSDVKDVLIDKDQNIWIATPGGLNILEQKTQKMHAYVADKGNKNALQTNYLISLKQSPNEDIWIGSMSGIYKVNQLDAHKLSFKLFKHDDNNRNTISGNYIIDIQFTDKGNLWVLTGNGLDYFNVETGSITHLKKPEEHKNSFLNKFYFDGKDKLWAIYGRNIYLHDIKNNTYKFILKAKSQIKNFLFLNDQIWYTTTTRLFQYDWKNKAEKIYSSQLTGIDIYRSGSIKVHNNNCLFLGGENGYLNFVPKNVNLEPITSSITLTSLEVLNKRVRLNNEVNGKVLLTKPIDELQKLELNHEENSFTLNFSTLDYRKDNSLTYAVKLEGLEDEWQILDGNRNYASYIKIKPGKYIFKAKVSNSFGKMGTSHTLLEIEIYPPIYATWWAKVCYFLILCVLFYVAHRVTVSNINFQNKFELEKIRREQDDEVHQMKLKFFTNISHELRTPLTLITSPLEELKAVEDDRQKQKLIEIIGRNTKRLSRLVNQVLDLRKLDQGAEKLALSSNDMIKLARNIVHDFMDAALQRSINLNFYTSEKESSFMFDFEKVEKVIYNLITNALKYTPDNGEIKVKIDRVKEKNPASNIIELCQRICVSDSGIGISKEVQTQIFERFVNVKIDNFIGQQGTGIGLSLVNDYVKMHNGWVDLNSSEGKGTEFIVYLPIENNFSKEQIIEESLSEESNQEYEFIEEEHDIVESNSAPKLLIIEDDTDMLSFLVHCFESDYHVITAKNGKEGWDLAKKQMPDLIISDWMMPEMNGVELCNKLKGNILTNHIPVIILTAKGGMENKMEGIEKGADDYISKPFNVEYLRVRVQNIINQRIKLNEKIKREFGAKEEEDKMPTFEQKFLNEIIAEIEKNIDNSDFNVKALGECIGMGQTNLYRKVKAMTGMTVNELIRTVRLKKAEQLLKQGEYNVTDVMYMVGFTHRSYFSRSFKDMFGISPKQFTKHNASETTLPS